jgi:hypothetical protein
MRVRFEKISEVNQNVAPGWGLINTIARLLPKYRPDGAYLKSLCFATKMSHL